MVMTRECLGVAELRLAQAHAAMAALVEIGDDRAVFLTHHDDGIFAHIGRDEISGIRELAFMGEK